eukprot:COSAG06_NODE_3758_length_4939_cov_1.872727_4_plen_204_part_00
MPVVAAVVATVATTGAAAASPARAVCARSRSPALTALPIMHRRPHPSLVSARGVAAAVGCGRATAACQPLLPARPILVHRSCAPSHFDGHRALCRDGESRPRDAADRARVRMARVSRCAEFSASPALLVVRSRSPRRIAAAEDLSNLNALDGLARAPAPSSFAWPVPAHSLNRSCVSNGHAKKFETQLRAATTAGGRAFLRGG